MALLKIGHRQPNQVMEQSSTDLEVQDVLHHHHDQRTDGVGGNLDRGEQSKAECKYHQQISITPCDNLIDGELQVKRAGKHEKFEDYR